MGSSAKEEDQREEQPMNPDMLEALQALAADKGISVDALLAALADALESAYKRMPNSEEYAWVTINPETADIQVFAQKLDDDGEPVGEPFDVTPDGFGRIAAQTAKQVMMQRIREVERELKYEEYAGREGDIVTGIIQQNDARYTLLDLGRVEALLPPAEQVPFSAPTPQPALRPTRGGSQDGPRSPNRGQPHPLRLIKRLLSWKARDSRWGGGDQGCVPGNHVIAQDRGASNDTT